jgi:PAS domain S-box-containing protein
MLSYATGGWGMCVLEDRHMVSNMLDHVRDGILAYKPIRNDKDEIVDFLITYCNAAGYRIVGLPEGSLEGMRLLEKFPGVIEEGLFEDKCRVLEDKAPLCREFWYPHEGMEKWFRITLLPKDDGLLLMFADITRRKQSEDALKDTQTHMELAMQAANDGIWDWDVQEDTVWFSDRCREMLGYRRDELPDSFKVWDKLMVGRKRFTHARRLNAHWGGGDEYQVLMRMRHKSGQTKHIMCRAHTVMDALGRPLRMVGAMTDVTELYASQEALERSRGMYNAISELQSMFIEGQSMRDICQRMTDYAMAFSGSKLGFVAEVFFDDEQQPYLHSYVPDAFPWREYISGQIWGTAERGLYYYQLHALLGQICLSRSTLTSEHFGSDLDRPIEPYLQVKRFVGVPLMHGDYLVGVVGLANRAMTYDDALLEELEPLFAAFAQIYSGLKEKRWREQVKKELVQARDAAEAANRTKDLFVANMSHEIRTPLNGVLGMAELLGRTDLDSRQREYLGYVLSSGETLLNLLNDILDVAKIESGAMSIQPTPTHLKHMLTEVIEAHYMNAEQKHLALNVEVAKELPEIMPMDRTRVKQVLENLMSNAVKFSESGRIQLSVRQVGTEKQPVVEFVVEDEGIGIASDDQERIFHAFTQVDNRLARSYEGAGLGLALCRELVQLMGGAIGVESTKEQGSRFWFHVPYKGQQALATTA